MSVIWLEICLRSPLRPLSQSKRKTGEIGGHISRMLLGLSLLPRAEGRQALGTRCHIWGPLLLGVVMGVLLAPWWKEPLTFSHQ